jgi:hypothetical protein
MKPVPKALCEPAVEFAFVTAHHAEDLGVVLLARQGLLQKVPRA